MARWELATDHYLKVPDCEWEYSETDQETGRTARKRYQIPEYLEKGAIVCWAGKGERRDHTFIGDPTPDMIPLDDEASEVSTSFESRWAYKPDGAEISSSQSIVNHIADVMTRPVEIPGLTDLVTAMSAQTKSNEAMVDALKIKVKF